MLDSFSPNTRVWIYQSPRPFSAAEQAWLQQEAKEFLKNWNAHGKPVLATVEVLNDRFVMIAADQDFTANSGCSIDSSVNFIRKAEQHLGINLMDRMLVTYKTGEELVTTTLQQLPALYASGEITDSTVVFNTLVADKPSFEKNWEVAIADSWHARFVK